MGLTQSASNIGSRPNLVVPSTGSGPSVASALDSYRGVNGSVRKKDAQPDQNRTDLVMVGFEILDLLGVALVICDPASRLLQANQSARCILRRSDGLRVDGSGRLRTSKPNSPALSEVIRELTEAGQAERSDTTHVVIAAHRPSGKQPLIMFVLNPVFPLGHTTGLVPTVPIVFWEHEGLCDAEQPFLYGIWGLTPAECRFANLLMEGLSLVDCCEHLGICRATGAFHLKNLFKKTGARRQIELLSILFRGVGPRSVGRRSSRITVPDHFSKLDMHIPET
jgi:DNA-binding CsgD family transcriptional regulator